MSLLDEICAKIRNWQFELSRHATNQSIIRHITMQEVREAIETCKMLEDYPEDKYGPSCLILGFTKSKRPLHIQCSYPSRPLIKIITLYEPDPLQWIDFKIRKKMPNEAIQNEILIEQKVTYTLEMNGKFFLIENVPARVNVETGEQYFSPKTVDRLQQVVWQGQPTRTVTLPVYEFTNST